MKISVCGKGGSGKNTTVTLQANASQERIDKVILVVEPSFESVNKKRIKISDGQIIKGEGEIE